LAPGVQPLLHAGSSVCAGDDRLLHTRKHRQLTGKTTYQDIFIYVKYPIIKKLQKLQLGARGECGGFVGRGPSAHWCLRLQRRRSIASDTAGGHA